jgi:hypothetical protein
MSTFNRIAALSAIAAVIGLTGCVVEREHDHGPYRYEHGDRIDRDGRHEEHWCERHHDEEHCRRDD